MDNEEKVENKIDRDVPNAYGLFKTSKKDEEQGVAVDYGSFVIHIKRAGPTNMKFQRLTRQINDSKGHAIRLGAVSETDLRETMISIYSQSVITDWYNMQDADGNVLEFTVDNCIQVMTDLPDLFQDIYEKATSFETFRAEQLGDMVKN